MIVTCENCKTRYNLDEKVIKESGSKVKCSKCHHMFTVYKPLPEEEPALELEEAPADRPESEEGPVSSPEPEVDQAAEEPGGVAEEAPEEVLDFDLSESKEEPADEEEITLEDLGLEEETPTEEPIPDEEKLPDEEEIAVEEEIALEDLGPEQETAVEETPDKTEEMAPEETPEGEERGATLEEVEAQEEQEEPKEELEGESKEAEEKPMPPPTTEKEPGARKRLSMPVMGALILVLLGGGAFGAYSLLKAFDVKIPFLESLTGAPESVTIDPGSYHISLMDQLISTKFVENKAAGRLFVISGKVRNDYPEARNFITVKGVLYSKEGKAVQKKTAYCGNVLSENDLEVMDKSAINKRLANRFGDQKSNFEVPSGKVIPFMIVFSDLPQDLEEFSVEVVSSVPGS